MHLSPIYKSFPSNLSIGLLLSAFVLVAVILKSVFRQKRNPTPSNLASNQAFDEMSTHKEVSLSSSALESSSTELELSDPLAGVYLPFTSGELAAMVEQIKNEGDNDQSGHGSSLTADQLEQVGERCSAYVQMFEGQSGGETWQQRIAYPGTIKPQNT